MYFNTTNLKGDELKERQSRARTQAQDVQEILELAGKPLGASEILRRLQAPNKNPPITSVRRALSNLKSSGKVIKTPARVTGMYGTKEYTWRGI